MNTATLRNWGGSVALPIPKALLGLMGLEAGHDVTFNLQGGTLLIKPVKARYTLAQLAREHKKLQLPVDAEWLNAPELASEQVF
jgi:antitoxin component of MazEF toxin-antitoxin module